MSNMDSDVVRELFRILDRAMTKPASFRVASKGRDGLAETVVLAVDLGLFNLKIKPLLGETELPKFKEPS